MAIYSYDRYTSTGQASFAITFDYLSSEHIKIYLDGALQSTGYTIDTGTNQVTFTSAPGSGTVVLVQRVTPKTKADYQAQIADFANGSVLTESDLDNAVLGLLYITQEAEDSGATNAISKDLADNTWDAEDTRIKDVGTPTAALDAVTKQYVDGLSLYNDAISVPQKWSFSGDTVETDFTLSSPDPASADVDMYVVDIDGVVQKPTTDFTISATTLTFGSAPASGTNNITVRNFGVARDILAQPIQPDSTSTVGLTVKGLASQTANLQNWTDSADAVKASVDKDGNLDLLTGALQIAGVSAIQVYQIVEAESFGSSDYSITATGARKVVGLRATITPKVSSSKLLVIGAHRIEAQAENENYAGAYSRMYVTASGSQSGQGSTVSGTQIGADCHVRERHDGDTQEQTSYFHVPIYAVHATGATDAVDIDLAIMCDGTETKQVSVKQSASGFMVIEIA